MSGLPRRETTDEEIWCEDCHYFGHADMGGEGWCDAYNAPTWYGNYCADCPEFTPIDSRRNYDR